MITVYYQQHVCSSGLLVCKEERKREKRGGMMKGKMEDKMIKKIPVTERSEEGVRKYI